jgi:hypothetical protein
VSQWGTLGDTPSKQDPRTGNTQHHSIKSISNGFIFQLCRIARSYGALWHSSAASMPACQKAATQHRHANHFGSYSNISNARHTPITGPLGTPPHTRACRGTAQTCAAQVRVHASIAAANVRVTQHTPRDLCPRHPPSSGYTPCAQTHTHTHAHKGAHIPTQRHCRGVESHTHCCSAARPLIKKPYFTTPFSQSSLDWQQHGGHSRPPHCSINAAGCCKQRPALPLPLPP